MTAILAYAEAGVAFVAGDGKRVSCAVPAIKVHRWSPTVVFAQAGNGPQLTALIGAMAYLRPIMGEDLNGFISIFDALRAPYHQLAAATKKINSNVETDGTLLVADADSAQVVALDFATGHPSTPQTPYGAAGVPNIHQSAADAWTARNAGPGATPLDLWAVDSIEPCNGFTVGWPITILITRPNDPRGAVTVERRLDQGWRASPDAAFLV